MNDMLLAIANKNINNANEGDYKNCDDILMCGKCHQPKQCVKEFPLGSGKMRKFPIICRCEEDEEEAYRKRQEKYEWERKQKELYNQGLTDKAYLRNTFENDDNRNPSLTALCRKYVEHWDEHKVHCHGILFYGNTGGGKSFYACCIANELLKKGVRVLVSRLSDLVKNRVDKTTFDVDITGFDLVVLDDIGTENATQTAYNVIDDIYRCGIPMIITTNLLPSELKSPDTMDKQRIYDRVIERCCITQRVDVNKTRLDSARKNREEAFKILRS